eukprot:m.10107 g.10107  ORF g.10107 m.10107 type:complete len:463 (-) comp8124_c0_seq1:195-1583(-)
MVPFRSSSTVAAPTSVLLSPSSFESTLHSGMAQQGFWSPSTDDNNTITNPNTSQINISHGLGQQRQHSFYNTPTKLWQPNPTIPPVAPEHHDVNTFQPFSSNSANTRTRTWAESNDGNDDDADSSISMDMDMDVDAHDVEVNRTKRRRTHPHTSTCTAPSTPPSFTSPPTQVVDDGMAIVECTPFPNLRQQQPNREHLQSFRANYVLDKMLKSRVTAASTGSIVPYTETESNNQTAFVIDFIRKLGLNWSLTQQGYTSSIFLSVKQDWLQRWKRQVDSDDVYRMIFKTEDGQEIMLEGGLQQQPGPLVGYNSDGVSVKMVLKLRELSAENGQRLLTWSPSSSTPPHLLGPTGSVPDMNASHNPLSQSATNNQWQHSHTQPSVSCAQPNVSPHTQPYQIPNPAPPPELLSKSSRFRFDHPQQSTNNEVNRKRRLDPELTTDNEHQENFQPQLHFTERSKRFKR